MGAKCDSECDRNVGCSGLTLYFFSGGPPRPGMLPAPPMGGPPMMPMMPPPHAMMPGGPGRTCLDLHVAHM